MTLRAPAASRLPNRNSALLVSDVNHGSAGLKGILRTTSRRSMRAPVYERVRDRLGPVKGDLRVGLDAPLPPELAVGAGTVVLDAGWCWTPDRAVADLALTVDGTAQPVLAHGMPRLDLLEEAQRRGTDPEGHAYRSGFWGLASV